LLAARGDVTVVHRVIDDLEQARALGMTGSPTLLVDGVDPFAVPGQPASVSCRLYLVDGRLAGSPSIEQLREVL
jgi:hypothetical protein